MDHTYQSVSESIDYLAHLGKLPENAGNDQKQFGILKDCLDLCRAADFFSVGFDCGVAYSDFVDCQTGFPDAVVYGWHHSPFGEIQIGQSEERVCWIGFRQNNDREYACLRMQAKWPKAVFEQNNDITAKACEQLIRLWETCKTRTDDKRPRLKLLLSGTSFQLEVWRALLNIPYGQLMSYRDVAEQIGKPMASRAVGNAVGANPISLIIPCHRVVQTSGLISNYGWGDARKKLLLALEAENISHAVKSFGLFDGP